MPRGARAYTAQAVSGRDAQDKKERTPAKYVKPSFAGALCLNWGKAYGYIGPVSGTGPGLLREEQARDQAGIGSFLLCLPGDIQNCGDMSGPRQEFSEYIVGAKFQRRGVDAWMAAYIRFICNLTVD